MSICGFTNKCIATVFNGSYSDLCTTLEAREMVYPAVIASGPVAYALMDSFTLYDASPAVDDRGTCQTALRVFPSTLDMVVFLRNALGMEQHFQVVGIRHVPRYSVAVGKVGARLAHAVARVPIRTSTEGAAVKALAGLAGEKRGIGGDPVGDRRRHRQGKRRRKRAAE